MTDIEKNPVLVSGPILPTVPNTPTRDGERIATIAEMENISNPSIGMTIYVEDEGIFYYVTALKSKIINGVTIANAVIDTYEYAYGKKTIVDKPEDELPGDEENPDNGETPDEGGDDTQEPTPEIPGGSTSNNVLDALPVGTIMQFSQAPDEKWLACDGSLVSKEDYPNLPCPEFNTIDLTEVKEHAIDQYGLIKICCSDDMFAIGVNSTVYYSTDKCQTWNKVPATSDLLSGNFVIAQYIGNRFLLITDTGYCAASENGIDWKFSRIVNSTFYYTSHVAYYNNRYIIANHTANVYESTDGTDWQVVNNVLTAGGSVYDIAAKDNEIYFLTSGKIIYKTSPTGAQVSITATNASNGWKIDIIQDKVIVYHNSNVLYYVINSDKSITTISAPYNIYSRLFEYGGYVFSSTMRWSDITSTIIDKQWTMFKNFDNVNVSGCANKDGVYFVYNSAIIHTTDLENIKIMNKYMVSSSSYKIYEVEYNGVTAVTNPEYGFTIDTDDNAHVFKPTSYSYDCLYKTNDGIFYKGLETSWRHTIDGVTWNSYSFLSTNHPAMYYYDGVYYLSNNLDGSASPLYKITFDEMPTEKASAIDINSYKNLFIEGKAIRYSSSLVYMVDLKSQTATQKYALDGDITGAAFANNNWYVFTATGIHVFTKEFGYLKFITGSSKSLKEGISYMNNIFCKQGNAFHSINTNGYALNIEDNVSNITFYTVDDNLYATINGYKAQCKLINLGLVLPIIEHSYIKAL